MIEVFIGILSGIVSSLGMGGGTILILLLTLFLGLDQKAAQGFNLIFFIPTSFLSIIIYLKEKLINIKLASFISCFGVIGAIWGFIIANKIQTQNLKKYFAFFLIIIVIYEIYSFFKEYINKEKRNNIKKCA